VQLFLVRHGETESNRTGLALGRADVALNETGLQQAQRLAGALAGEPLSAVYSSPLSRTMRTAEAIALGHGLTVGVEDGLIEMDVGEADGLTFAEMRSRYPGLLESWVSDEGPGQAMPGGERLVDVQERGWRTVQELAARHEPDAAICVVSHNFVILSVLCTALGIDLANFRRLRHQVAAISLLDMGPGRARVQRLNDVCHLGSL
jgi:broad specificity phosphatase PhoE